jgi:hypothetical protein
MTADIARPERMVDASAYIASQITGVAQAFGCGAGTGMMFPGGKTITPIPTSGPLEAYTHTSELPTAPTVSDLSATVTELLWQIPMRLHLDAGDQENLRLQAAPFYGRYLAAFAANAQLGGAANSARIVSFSLGGDPQHGAWLEMVLACWERLNLERTPGPRWLL